MRLKLLSLVLLVSLALAACAQPAAAPQPTAAPAQPTAAPAPTQAPTAAPAAKVPVGIVLPTKDEPRWVQDQTRFTDALKAAGFDVQILFSQGDSAKEKANVEALISQGIKVLIICPQDGKAAAAAADEAHAAGVKVIAYDRAILDTASVDYYVTFDSIAVGKAQGQYLVDHAKGTGNPLYLYAGAASDNNAFVFFQGAWSVLQPKIADGTFVIKNSAAAVGLQSKATLTRDEQSQIIGQVTTNWDFNTAKNLAESNLTAATAADKGNVFILAPNDGTARAIADAFGADKDVKSYLVTGQDAEKASVQYIIDGKQSMTVFKDVRTLVADAITAAVAFLNGQTPPSTAPQNNGKIDVPAKPSAVVTVDKSNVQSALIASGYYQASDFTGLGAVAAAPTAAPTAAPAATPVVRGGPKDIILATTTSTRDSGLLDVLLPMFQKATGYNVQMIAVGSGAALAMGQAGNADVLLVHSPAAEKTYMDGGYGISRTLVMHNDFIIVGPADDPAKIKDLKSSVGAFKAIADAQATFVSRGDKSGTNAAELAIWKKVGITPTVDSKWYLSTGSGMGDTLNVTNEKGGYTLTDRATYLATKSKLQLDILVQGDISLLNIYHVIVVNPDKFPVVNIEGAKAFADWLVAPDTQAFIAKFGVDKYGQQLFYPDAGKNEADLGK